ncbi:MAG: T9SS type A sorting domain-containing protein [Dysgonamonadaceae bacterium]|nr:T9SS type A sorting domain-containing protein [Dysgonamonadaceae bacterium]
MRATMTHYFRQVALIAVMYFFSVNMSGQIQISSEAGLRAIADNLAGDYILTDNITLTQDWIPIGDEQHRFTGTINGNGKTVYGLKSIDTSRDGAGFIGVAEGATIENLSIIGLRVYGSQDAGGIVGRAYAPTYVEKCYTSGVVSGWDHIGGIIGGSRKSNPEGEFSAVNNCFSTAAVISTDHQAGGIVGAAIDLSVENSYFAGVAQCINNRTGGIIALVDGGTASIQNSAVMAYFLKGGSDRANRILGGVNDNAFCDLYNNHSWENTEVYHNNVLFTGGESNSYGFDGQHTAAATMKSASFYTETLGWNNPVWKIENGNYPVFSYHSLPLDGDGIYVPIFPERALPGTTFNAKAISALNRTVSYSSSDPSVASIDNQGLVSFIKNGTTTLTFSTQGDASYTGATFTMVLKVEGISYQIVTGEDLKNIKYDLSGDFTLMNNITLQEEWQPLGVFKGKFNGNGHIIYGLKYENKGQNDVGLFAVAEGAVITKLGIEKAEFTGNADVGAIVGTARGCIISECYVADSYVAGRDHIGSIVGAMRDYEKVITPGDPDLGIEDVKEKVFTEVRNCHAAAQIYSREFQAGGIAGIICGGTLENCYFSGVVQAMLGRAAGIVSLVDNSDPGEVKNNISLAAGIYCPYETYRIGDWGSRGPESGNYATKFINNWSAQNSYLGSSYDLSAIKTSQDANDRDGKTLSAESQARMQSFYTSTLGWDFTNTWKYIAGTDGKMYPVLKWQNEPLFSTLYGVPENPHLIYPDPNGELEINLSKIIPTYGQELKFEITEGANFVEKEGNKYFVTERPLSAGGWTKFTISLMDNSLNNIFAMQIPKLEVEIILTSQVFELKTVADILAINNRLFAKYRLMNDINMAGVKFSGIGSANSPFTGELDGNGYSIISAKVTVSDENKKGFFNATQGAKIQKFGLSDFSFAGSYSTGGGDCADLGGLVGSCKNTTIDQCYVTGKVTGRDHVGGLIGGDCDNVTVSNTYVDVIIEAGQQAGGFFGVTAGDNITVRNSYFTGSISAVSRGWVGGIIGLIDRSGNISISGCASIGDLSCVEKTGAFIGGNGVDGNTGTISTFYNNIYNYDSNFKGEEVWFIESTVPGTIDYANGKSPSQLKQKATYTAVGWDFDNIWTITEGQSYPQLKTTPFKQATNIPFVATGKSNYTVYTENDKVHISGIQQSAVVAVYNVNGQLQYQSAVSNNASLPLNSKGFYIVRITENDKTVSVKVINK